MKPMNPAQAEEIALKALAWLASDDEQVSHFLAMSGADASDLAQAAQNPEFLGFVVDYVLMDDQSVLACACHADLDPENIALARHFLPGGDVPNWT